MIQMKFVRFSPCRSGSEDFAKICIMFIKLPHFHDTFVGNYQDVADVNASEILPTSTLENRCLSCWQHGEWSVHRCAAEILQEEPSGTAVPCHYIKGPFSHIQGQTVDNSSLLLQRLASLFNNETLSDITVIVGEDRFYAHKVILCSSSEVFKIMLTNDSWSDSEKQSISLQEEDVCVGVFQTFLYYFYSAVIHLSHSNVLPILMLADKYDVMDLQVLCCDYMISHLVSTVSENQAVCWYEYALLANHSALARRCEQFITCNFRKIASTKYFYDMQAMTLEHFIVSSDLVIQDEYTLFQILAKWLRHNSTEKSSDFDNDNSPLPEPDTLQDAAVRVDDDNALTLLACIRFPMMPPQHLVQLEQDPLARCFREFFMTQIELAMKLHYCAEPDDDRQRMLNKRRLLQPHQQHLIRARCYTDATWCTTFNVDNYMAVKPFSIQAVAFSSPVSAAQVDEKRSFSWQLDVYPKGVHFDKFCIVSLLRKLQGPSAAFDLFRLMLKCSDRLCCTVDVAVLLYSCQDNVEFVNRLYTRRCVFDHDTTAYNLDDVLQLSDFTSSLGQCPYFVGKFSDGLKFSIIIKPV